MRVDRKEFFVSLLILGIEAILLILIRAKNTVIDHDSFFVLLLITAASSIFFCQSKQIVVECTNTLSKRLLIIASYFFLAFQLVGYNCFIYPLNKAFSILDLMIYLLTVIWTIPIENSFILLVVKLSKSRKQFFDVPKPLFYILCFGALIVPAAFCLIVYNPGITSYDSYATMVINAKQLKGMVDWHPAFYCFIIHIIEMIWDSTYAVVFTQYLFWLFVVFDLIVFLRREGCSDISLLLLSLFLGFNASNVLYLNTIWKDIPYGISLLWLFIAIAKVVEKSYKSKVVYIELFISLILVFFLRQNGIVPYLITAAGLLIIFWKDNKKIVYAIIATVVGIIIIKGPVYSALDIQHAPQGGAYVGLSQEILAVYYNDGFLSENSVDLVKKMTGDNPEDYVYYPTWSYQDWPYVDTSCSEFVIAYIDTFLHNPKLVISALIARNDAIWDIFKPDDAILGTVNYRGTNDGFERNGLAWNDFYPKRNEHEIKPEVDIILNKTVTVQLLNIACWRSGVYVFLSIMVVVSLVVMIGFKKEIVLILLPEVGQVLGLLLSTGWADFRYYWPINLLSVSLVFVSVVICRNRNAGIGIE